MVRSERLAPEGPLLRAAGDPRSEGVHRAFFAIFNGISVALVFWLCFVVAFTSQLRVLPLESGWDWVVDVAYLTRQNLASGLLVLLAVALGSALLPERLSPRARWMAMIAMLAVAAALSTCIRLAMSRYPMHGAKEWAVWFADVVAVWTLLGSIAYGLVGSIRRQTAARRRLGQQIAEQNTLTAAALEARLTVLQAQIEPHFLFNTLANVRRLCEVDPERGRRMLASLLDYLRAALPAMRRSSTPLGQEFALVRAYLSVLQHRMGERLRFRIELPERLAAAPIPPLILPTLVENALRHGLGPLPEGGTITVRAAQDGAQIALSVADDGAGFQAASGSGVGLANTRARLSALFGSAAGLTLRANQPRGVIAEVRLPYMETGKATEQATGVTESKAGALAGAAHL
ncbi:MAG TPA: histidine kinase [Burkholderiaceae bacterium]|jgi:signal transduction histidine kinase|nr:histidine kinase [Burkholderiaceae bacterium]